MDSEVFMKIYREINVGIETGFGLRVTSEGEFYYAQYHIHAVEELIRRVNEDPTGLSAEREMYFRSLCGLELREVALDHHYAKEEIKNKIREIRVLLGTSSELPCHPQPVLKRERCPF